VVQDAYQEVAQIALFQTQRPGGHGAVREVCDLFERLLAQKGLNNED
jgi:3-deoxy-D-manno-octulosonate 8-phosphate phosphatase KdsC-like HAD superfamily phosphatase